MQKRKKQSKTFEKPKEKKDLKQDKISDASEEVLVKALRAMMQKDKE